MAAISISRLITGIAEADPDRLAITHEDQKVTRKELDHRTNRLARDYQQRGVKSGDMVTVGLPNSISFYEACIATWKLGATPQPISARLPQIERQAIVDLAKPAIVVGANPADHPGVVVLPVGYEAVLQSVMTPCRTQCRQLESTDIRWLYGRPNCRCRRRTV